MPKKRTVTILLVILAVCLLFTGVYVFMNLSTTREPTQQEIEACAPYAIDWQAATGQEGSDQEIILSLCTFAEEKTIGENQYQLYTSETLGGYLYDFQEMMEIAVMNDILYVQYTDPQNGMVILGYDDAGLTEKMVYDLETDTCYHEYQGEFQVYVNFRNGFQLGA